MNKKLVVSHKVLALLGEEESRVIDTLDGEIYRTEERHYLHVLFGRINKALMPYATKHPISNKAVQELVSARRVEPLIALGLMEYATSPCKPFDLHLIVDENGTLLRVEMKDGNGVCHRDSGVLNRAMNVQDFIYRCIGTFYTQKGA